MYAPSWLSDQSLIDSLQQEPWRWQSAQAVRVLENAGLQVEHGSQPAYCYPVSELSHAKRAGRGWRLVSTLPAMNGYHGVLPYGYQDLEQHQRLALDDSGIYDFLSVINHRVLQQSNTVVLRSYLSIRYEQEYVSGKVPGKHILSVSGLPTPQVIPVENFVRYSAVLARRTTSLELLANILKDYFCFEFSLEPPPVIRMLLARDCLTKLHTRIDHKTESPGRLGDSTLLGRSGYLLHSCVNVVIFTKTLKEYKAATSDPGMAPAVLEMCTIYFACIARFRLQIKCPRSFLESPRLSSKPGNGVARLGRLSCLMPELHPQQLIIVDYPPGGFSERESHAAA